jgi:hypothetical protein
MWGIVCQTVLCGVSQVGSNVCAFLLSSVGCLQYAVHLTVQEL